MHIVDGRKIRDSILDTLKARIASLSFTPIFCDVLVGNNPASAQYVKMKVQVAESLGIKTHPAVFAENITTEELISEIKKIASIPKMSGLIIQLPLPAHIDTKRVLDCVPEVIDVDSTSSVAAEKFYSNEPIFIFPTAAAVMTILDSLDIDFRDKTVVVVGKGMLVGRPVAQLLKNREVIVFSLDNSSSNMEDILKTADIVITATGKTGLIHGDMIQQGAILIDAGASESDGSIAGDVDKDSVIGVASALSPVPGGVGPVTVAMLMQNVVISAERINGI